MGEQLLPLPIQFRIHLVGKRSFIASNSTPPPPPHPQGLARAPTLFVASREKYVVERSSIECDIQQSENHY